MKEHPGMDVRATIEDYGKEVDDYQSFNIGLLSLTASFAWETLQSALSVFSIILFMFHAFCLRNVHERATVLTYVSLFLLTCVLRLTSVEAILPVGFIGLAAIALTWLVILRKSHYRVLLGFVTVVLAILLNQV